MDLDKSSDFLNIDKEMKFEVSSFTTEQDRQHNSVNNPKQTWIYANLEEYTNCLEIKHDSLRIRENS